MKKSLKNIMICLTMLFIGAVAFMMNGEETFAAETKLVTFTFSNEKGKNYTVDLSVYEDSAYSSGYNYKFSTGTLYLPIGTENEKWTVTKQIYSAGAVTVSDVSCYESVELSLGTTIYFNVGLQTNVTLDWSSYFKIVPYRHLMSVDNMAISAGTKGNQRFNPGKKNYMLIRSNLQISVPSDKSANIRVRVYNNKNKFVYEKFIKNVNGNGLLNMKWDGKASKGNEAGVKAAYVKAGTYKAEVALVYNDNGIDNVITKRCTFKVSKKAPAGTKGIAKAKDIVMYTGNPNVDYMAEKMIKAAGVKSGMSDDQKVKKIYHYMTKKFKHKHYDGTKRKNYYNLTKLKSKIASFQKKTEKKYAKGTVVYNYAYGYTTEFCMSTRSGVCNDHAEIFKILCNHVGVEAEVCGGYYKNRNGSLAGHAWNSAIVNGKTYYYDVDVEIQNYGGGQGDYYWYKKTLKEAKKNHVFY